MRAGKSGKVKIDVNMKNNLSKKYKIGGKEYKIYYIESPDIEKILNAVRRERVDKDGNEVWFNMLLEFFIDSPYAKKRSLNQYEELLIHLRHRQTLELQICREIFGDKVTVVQSKAYDL